MIFPYVFSLIVLAAALYGGKYMMDLSTQVRGDAAGWYGAGGAALVIACLILIGVKILP